MQLYKNTWKCAIHILVNLMGGMLRILYSKLLKWNIVAFCKKQNDHKPFLNLDITANS